MVQHLVVAAELRILVLDCVEAVGAGGDNLLDLVAVEGLDVLLGQGLVEVLVANAPRRVAGAFFLFAEDGELDARRLQDAPEGLHRLAVALIERAEAADEEDDLSVRGFCQGGDVKRLGPVATLGGGELPQVAVALHVGEGAVDLGGEAALLQHQIAAHIHDAGHRLNEHRAGADARLAGGAGPQHIVGNHVTNHRHVGNVQVMGAMGGLSHAALVDLVGGRHRLHLPRLEQLRPLLQHIILQVKDDCFGVERLAGGVSRTGFLAAATLGAGYVVEQVAPGELVNLADPIMLLLLDVLDLG